MITTMLESRAFSRTALEYNEDKVNRYEAKLVHSMNMPATHPYAVFDTFEKMETNPRIPAQTRSRSFHMAVNPGPEDVIDEAGVIRYVDDLMNYLGYKDQPVVVYRHEDIGRIHYHVCSTRFNTKGQKINDSNEGYRILEFNKAFGDKYGFHVGANVKASERSDVETPKVFNKKCKNFLLTLDRLYTEALRYPVRSRSQMQALLLSMNVGCRFRQRKDGGYNVVLQGLDDAGRGVTRLYSMEKQVGREAFGELDGRIAMTEEELQKRKSTNTPPSMETLELLAKMEFCISHSKSFSECAGLLKGLGMNLSSERNADGTLRRVLVADPETHSLVDAVKGGTINIDVFRRMEASGKWKKPAARTGAAIKVIKMPAEMMKELVAFIKERVQQLLAMLTGGARRGVSTGHKINKSLK